VSWIGGGEDPPLEDGSTKLTSGSTSPARLLPNNPAIPTDQTETEVRR
jgi:hypothetical protein